MAASVVQMRELTSRITLQIKGLRGFGVRLWLARKCFLLGAWVAGVGIKFERSQD